MHHLFVLVRHFCVALIICTVENLLDRFHGFLPPHQRFLCKNFVSWFFMINNLIWIFQLFPWSWWVLEYCWFLITYNLTWNQQLFAWLWLALTHCSFWLSFLRKNLGSLKPKRCSKKRQTVTRQECAISNLWWHKLLENETTYARIFYIHSLVYKIARSPSFRIIQQEHKQWKMRDTVMSTSFGIWPVCFGTCKIQHCSLWSNFFR